MRAFVEATAPGCALTIPREVVVEWLTADSIEDAPVDAQERDELTAAEWAALEHRSPGTVCAWLAAGLVPGAYKLNGREWRVPRAGIVAFKTEQARQHPAPERIERSVPNPPREAFDWREYRRNRRESKQATSATPEAKTA